MDVLGREPKDEPGPRTNGRYWPGAASDYGTKNIRRVSCPSERHMRGPRCGRGLIFGLIRLRSPTFIGIQINAAMQVTDVNDIRRTVIPTPENRKVDDSALPLAATCIEK